MHLGLIFTVLYESIVILVFKSSETRTLKDVANFLYSEIVGSGLVTSNVEVVFQLLSVGP